MGRYELVNDFSYLVTTGTAACVTCLVLFKFIGPILSSRLTSSYNYLNAASKADWNSRITSNLNAVVSICLAGYIFLYDEGIYEDYVWYNSPLSRTACAFVIGYMIADVILMMLYVDMPRGEKIGFLFHHAASIYAYYFVTVNGILCYFAMLRLIAEASTPTVNQRWFFDTAGVPRTHILVILNGFSMVLTFFLFRIVVMPIFWYRIWLVSGTEATLALGHIQIIMFAPSMVLDSLNLFWFYKMCRGFVKALVKVLNKKRDHDA